MRVLLDPSEARLEASDLQADQAVEGVVDSRRTGVHPAEDVVVNLAVQVTDGAVDAVRP